MGEKYDLVFKDGLSAEDWLEQQDVQQLAAHFENHGYLVCERLIDKEHLAIYQQIYDDFLNGTIDASKHRHDLGSHEKTEQGKENITQIMWPSSYMHQLRDGPIHRRLEVLAKALLGTDMVFDFDSMISKPPDTNVKTPWHQDESYWLDMPDKRAISFWVALQDVNADNGCMWFVPGSHKLPLREHWKAKEGHHVNQCECSEAEGLAVPLSAGGCTGHHGHTLHYTRGNKSKHPRRAFIVGFRPQSMVDYERENNFDYGLTSLASIAQSDYTLKQRIPGEHQEEA